MTGAPRDVKALRSFGLIVGGVFALIGLWPWVFRQHAPRTWALAAAAALVLPAIVWPRALAPAHRAWMRIGHALGWLNSRILLGIVFFFVVTPLGFVLRLLGKDPLGRRFDPRAETYRMTRQARPGTHMTRQF